MVRKNNRVSDINEKIGSKIFELRISKGMPRSVVAGLLEITGQQVQKYEKGENIISAARLIILAEKLNVPISYFFEDFESLSNLDEKQRLNMLVSKNFGNLKNEKTKNAINKLLVTLRKNEEKEDQND